MSHVTSSGNVYQDLGYPDAEEMELKAWLVSNMLSKGFEKLSAMGHSVKEIKAGKFRSVPTRDLWRAALPMVSDYPDLELQCRIHKTHAEATADDR